MNLFIDTSSLIKLYHEEGGSSQLRQYFEEHADSEVLLSRLTELEFASALWKKVRTKELSVLECKEVLNYFQIDSKNYNWIDINPDIVNTAQALLSVYGEKGLRTLDSIQFATALTLKSYNCMNLVSDKLLSDFLKAENLDVFYS